jgi:hypothetical protein
VNPNGAKVCQNLPTITWPFVTGIAKGEPHHWTSMGGDAQRGDLSVMFKVLQHHLPTAISVARSSSSNCGQIFSRTT